MKWRITPHRLPQTEWSQWETWFCWRPVAFIQKGIKQGYWLCFVHRRYREHWGHIWSEEIFREWAYREIPATQSKVQEG